MPTERHRRLDARHATPDRQRSIQTDDRSRARLRWRCRRGMLENDLILTRFLDARGDTIDEEEVAALDRLLDLADNELWDLLSGRAEPEDATLRPLLALLRAA
jgi:antitoxin CptB